MGRPQETDRDVFSCSPSLSQHVILFFSLLFFFMWSSNSLVDRVLNTFMVKNEDRINYISDTFVLLLWPIVNIHELTTIHPEWMPPGGEGRAGEHDLCQPYTDPLNPVT